MPAFADVIPEKDLDHILDYLIDGEPPARADGEQLAKDQGCLGCHTTDGSQLVGPSFKGIFGRETELEGDDEIVADEAYLLRSMTHPEAEVVEGFPPIMPAYEHLSDAELKALVDYLKGLK